jgi:ligand-binding SRPBCC domain-containing protein
MEEAISMQHARFRSRIAVPVSELFEWHARPGAFERLVPPWQSVEIVDRTGDIHDGDTLAMDIRLGPLRKRWLALHSDYIHGSQFRDTQIKGPFKHWVHTHVTLPDGPGASILDDRIAYALPIEVVTSRVAARIAAQEIRRMFRYRHFRTATDLARHGQYLKSPRQTVSILGDHPVTGQVAAFLTGGAHRVSKEGDACAIIDLSSLSNRRIAPPSSGNVDIWISVQPLGSKFNDQIHARRSVVLRYPDVLIGPSLLSGDVLSSALRDTVPDKMVGRDQRQWLAADDLIGAIYSALMNDKVSGEFVITPAERSAGQIDLPGFAYLYPDESFARRVLAGRV